MCGICNKKFKMKLYLDSHMKSHTGDHSVFLFILLNIHVHTWCVVEMLEKTANGGGGLFGVVLFASVLFQLNS